MLRLTMSSSVLFKQGVSPSSGDPPRERSVHPAPRKSACKVKGLVEKRKVFLGIWPKTCRRGLVATDLRYNAKSGRVVSAKKSEEACLRYAGSKLHKWNVAMMYARKRIGCEGFVKMGKGEEGHRLQEYTRAVYEELLKSGPQGCLAQ